MAKKDQLIEIIQPVVTGMGFIFWGIEYQASGKHSLLRVFIDHADGILVDQCAEVSRQISAVMDVEDPISSEYSLEVSSPGMDRPLFTLEQFEAYTGATAQIRLNVPLDNRRKFVGMLKGVENDEVVLECEGSEYVLPIETIDKAQVIPTFE